MNVRSKRHFTKGDKVTVSIRLPFELIKVIKFISRDRGYAFSDFIQEGLDQWAYAHTKEQK